MDMFCFLYILDIIRPEFSYISTNHYFSYMADITNERERTSRLSVLDGTDYISTMLGTFASAPLFSYFGYYVVFGSSGTLALIGFLYAVFIVKESVPQKSPESEHIKEYFQQNNSHPVDYGTRVVDQREPNDATGNDLVMIQPSKRADDVQSCKNYTDRKKQNSCCKQLPNLADIMSSFKVIVRSRPGRNRAMVIM